MRADLDQASRRVRVRASDVRRLYVLQHPFVMSSEAAAFLATVLLLARPDILHASSIGIAFPDAIAYGWLLTLGAGGACAIAGVVVLSSKLEAAGLVLLAVAYAVYALAFPGVRGTGGYLAACILGGMAFGAGGRALLIVTRPEVQPWRQRHTPC